VIKMVKISEFMVGLIAIGFFSAVFVLFMGAMQSNYDVEYDNSSMVIYDQLDELNVQAEDIKTEVSGISEKPGILDVIGSYFSDAYKALKLTKNSFDVFDDMSNAAIDDANMGAVGGYLRIVVGSIMIILIFVAVFISALVKWEL